MREEKEEEKAKLALVLAAKSRSLLYTSSPASPRVFASPIHTLASVPFCWEDQPGKPKNPLRPLSYPKCLDLPPRLLLPGEFTQMPLPERKHGLLRFLRRKGRAGEGMLLSGVIMSFCRTIREQERSTRTT
ncbi:unnamed protein product [Arabidopsis lyrata]|nr:unnamed protein product [Arabidopsis lyrata]